MPESPKFETWVRAAIDILPTISGSRDDKDLGDLLILRFKLQCTPRLIYRFAAFDSFLEDIEAELDQGLR